MKYLSLEQLVALHAMLVASTGGSDGVRDIGRLQSAIASQTQEVFGNVLYSTVYEKAAAIIRGIIEDHPFVDGNKRAGMLAGLTLLESNGANLELKPSELEDFAVQVATEHLSVADIASWLERHSVTRGKQ